MSQLSESSLLRLVGQTYDAATDPELWDDFLGSLSGVFGGGAVLFSQDMRSTDAGIAKYSGFDPGFVASYASEYAAHNVWLSTAAHDSEGTVVVGHERVSSAELKKTLFFADWLKPQGLSDTCGSILLRRQDVLTNLAIIRGPERGPFSGDELVFWAKLTPHIRRSLLVHREIHSINRERGGALQALYDLGVGILICNRFGRVSFVNRVAEEALSSAGALVARSGVLQPAIGDDRLGPAIKRAVLSSNGDGQSSGEIVVLSRADGTSVPVMVSPLRCRGTLLPLEEPACILLVADSKVRGTTAANLGRIYGLTLAEAEVLSDLLAGRAVNEIAEHRSVEASTVRSQVKAILQKTGASRQSDLVRMVLSNPLLSRTTVSQGS